MPGLAGDGTRAADLGNAQVALLEARGEWGRAEELALAVLATTPETVTTMPYLLTRLGAICETTGRLDEADDYLARAADAFVAMGDSGEHPELLLHRGSVAMRRGDLDRAERLYAQAAAVCEQRGLPGDLAVCVQALGWVATLRGDAAGAEHLVTTSLASFDQHGLATAAADSALLASQLAYGRGDIAEMQRLAEQARAVYEERGMYHRCAQLDFLAAACVEDRLDHCDYGEHEAEAIDTALALALPAALALEAARYAVADSNARSQWLEQGRAAMRLVFRLAVRRGDQGLLFELVEFRCTGAPLALDSASAEAAASLGLSVALPPKVLMSPHSDRTALPATGDGMRHAFESGAMAAYDTEHRLARLLSEALWPVQLTDQLRQVSARLGRPLVRIQPSPRVAQVPWELLAAADDDRLIDLADVVTTVPASLRRPGARPSPQAGDRSDAVVVVLDPAVPGYPASSALGSVLGRADPALVALVQRHLDAGRLVPSAATATEAFRRTDLDRDCLGAVLREGPRRLMYVGHVTRAAQAGGQSENAQLHLCCGPDTSGYTALQRTHRPLSAKDLLLGARAARADGVPGALIWPAPPRVALIACESGGDLRFAESFGLASAMIHNGAELVTATRWALPTSHAFHRFAGLAETNRPLSDVIVAVDAAHDHPDPVHRLGHWKREKIDRRRATGRVADSPLLWAAVCDIMA